MNNIIEKENFVKLGKVLDVFTMQEVSSLVALSDIGEEFNYDAEIKYLYYQEGKLLGVIAYMLVKAGDKEIPMFIHIILAPEIKRTRKAYKFLLDTFIDVKKEYNIIVAHIDNNKTEMIKFAEKVGFKVYAEEKDSKYYYF